MINGKQETVEQAFNRVYNFVESQLVEKVTEANEKFNDENPKSTRPSRN